MSDKKSVTHQVMWNRLISIVEEQAQALIRTAFSTSAREAGDLSAGIYDTKGHMLAQAVTGTPGHVNAMAAAVGHFIDHIGKDRICEGDVYITNDPWLGTGHLHDITIVTPSFYQGQLIGFFASTAHIVDIGGRGFTADANSIYEEGLYLPIMKFYDQGKVDQTLISIVRANVREPDQVVGDFLALATCNETGHKRLIEMMHEFQLNDIEAIAEFILDHSRRATLACINKLNPLAHQASGEMTIDGYDIPVTLKAKIEIEKNRVSCDFSGSSGIDRQGINVPLVYTQAYACYALKCAIAPHIPNNAASLAPFEITAPENSILNALHPAPVALRHVIGHMIPDAVYNALDQVLPELVPSEGAGTICNFQVSARPRKIHDTDQLSSDELNAIKNATRGEVLTFNSGGAGARPSLDGLNATAFPSGVMTMPVEATETAGPVIIWRKELRPDSGGPGEFRGGLGQYMEVGVIEGHECDFSAMFDRVEHPARGRHGGKNGSPMTIALDNGQPLKGKGTQFIPHDRKVCMAFPGGGGHGNPENRDINAVHRDLARGYISAEHAQKHYHLDDKTIRDIEVKIVHGEDLNKK